LLWSAFDSWARRYGVLGSDFDFFWACLRALDTEFLEHARKYLTEPS